jgi:hypothetical protein
MANFYNYVKKDLNGIHYVKTLLYILKEAYKAYKTWIPDNTIIFRK